MAIFEQQVSVEFISGLNQHQQAINLIQNRIYMGIKKERKIETIRHKFLCEKPFKRWKTTKSGPVTNLLRRLRKIYNNLPFLKFQIYHELLHSIFLSLLQPTNFLLEFLWVLLRWSNTFLYMRNIHFSNQSNHSLVRVRCRIVLP